MLSSDPILSVHCREHLPTDDEVRKTSLLLASRPSLQEAFERTVRIANDTYATLERWIFVTKVEGHCGDDVAIQTVEALEKCLEARRRLSMDSILRHPPFDHTFLQLFTKVLPLGFHGVTRDGNPVVIIRYGAVDTTRLSDLWQRGQAQAIDGANAFTMCFIRCVPEYVTRVLMFDESLRQGRTVDRIVAVIDVGGVGRNHWQNCFLRFVQQYVQFSGFLHFWAARVRAGSAHAVPCEMAVPWPDGNGRWERPGGGRSPRMQMPRRETCRSRVRLGAAAAASFLALARKTQRSFNESEQRQTIWTNAVRFLKRRSMRMLQAMKHECFC
eukprot:TRINITY_DN12259_c0_g1_i2.p1 TRINITY_DN12259_c0_g1~~TRINITY_DN12259_c0_g1_i2.p1  ORF type:complete len:328 (-),score=33.74 TRINITY_DN12259_c0_g1_i2:103-1086(-)